MFPTRLTTAGVATLLLSGCAIKQEIRAVGTLESPQVCIVSNPAVRQTFSEALARSLKGRGYEPRMLEANSSSTSCPVVLTYSANWRWDLALYMAYAEIRVFKAGQESGSAIYDSTRGGGNMGKFIDAEKKVGELTAQVFPAR